MKPDWDARDAGPSGLPCLSMTTNIHIETANITIAPEVSDLAEQLDRVEQKVDFLMEAVVTLIGQQAAETTREIHMSEQLNDVLAAAAEQRTVTESAITTLHGLAAKIEELVEDPAALTALAAELRDQAGDLAAAVADSDDVLSEPTPPEEPPVEPPVEPPAEPTPEP